jgi:hypothetical protein
MIGFRSKAVVGRRFGRAGSAVEGTPVGAEVIPDEHPVAPPALWMGVGAAIDGVAEGWQYD